MNAQGIRGDQILLTFQAWPNSWISTPSWASENHPFCGYSTAKTNAQGIRGDQILLKRYTIITKKQKQIKTQKTEVCCYHSASENTKNKVQNLCAVVTGINFFTKSYSTFGNLFWTKSEVSEIGIKNIA